MIRAVAPRHANRTRGLVVDGGLQATASRGRFVMRVCTHCGVLAPTTNRFCRYDGHALVAATDASESVTERMPGLATSRDLGQTQDLPPTERGDRGIAADPPKRTRIAVRWLRPMRAGLAVAVVCAFLIGGAFG